MAQSNEERIRFDNDEIVWKGNLDLVDEVFASEAGSRRTTCGWSHGDNRI